MNKQLLVPTFILVLGTMTSLSFASEQATEATTGAAQGGKILVPVGKQNGAASVQLPAKGLSQTAVSDQFGQPEKKTEAVGQPPISRWYYTDFTVYFEGDTVVHSVLKHKPVNPGFTNNQ